MASPSNAASVGAANGAELFSAPVCGLRKLLARERAASASSRSSRGPAEPVFKLPVGGNRTTWRDLKQTRRKKGNPCRQNSCARLLPHAVATDSPDGWETHRKHKKASRKSASVHPCSFVVISAAQALGGFCSAKASRRRDGLPFGAQHRCERGIKRTPLERAAQRPA